MRSRRNSLEDTEMSSLACEKKLQRQLRLSALEKVVFRACCQDKPDWETHAAELLKAACKQRWLSARLFSLVSCIILSKFRFKISGFQPVFIGSRSKRQINYYFDNSSLDEALFDLDGVYQINGLLDLAVNDLVLNLPVFTWNILYRLLSNGKLLSFSIIMSLIGAGIKGMPKCSVVGMGAHSPMTSRRRGPTRRTSIRRLRLWGSVLIS